MRKDAGETLQEKHSSEAELTLRSKRKISALPLLAAQCRGDQPMALNTWTSAPLCGKM
jgi:hypothetical protein